MKTAGSVRRPPTNEPSNTVEECLPLEGEGSRSPLEALDAFFAEADRLGPVEGYVEDACRREDIYPDRL